MIIDTHLHVWSDDFNTYPFADGRSDREAAPVELLNETIGTASACGYGAAIHENLRERATWERRYLRRTTRRRSASAGRLAALPSRGHARRFASAPLAPRAI